MAQVGIRLLTARTYSFAQFGYIFKQTFKLL